MAKKKDKIEIKDEKNLVGNRKSNCVTDKYSSINCRDRKVVSVLRSTRRAAGVATRRLNLDFRLR